MIQRFLVQDLVLGTTTVEYLMAQRSPASLSGVVTTIHGGGRTLRTKVETKIVKIVLFFANYEVVMYEFRKGV